MLSVLHTTIPQPVPITDITNQTWSFLIYTEFPGATISNSESSHDEISMPSTANKQLSVADTQWRNN